MSRLIRLPALQNDAVDVARLGTALWAAAAIISWIWQFAAGGQPLGEFPQIATAGFILGLIGTRHVTRRSRRLGLRP